MTPARRNGSYLKTLYVRCRNGKEKDGATGISDGIAHMMNGIYGAQDRVEWIHSRAGRKTKNLQAYSKPSYSLSRTGGGGVMNCAKSLKTCGTNMMMSTDQKQLGRTPRRSRTSRPERCPPPLFSHTHRHIEQLTHLPTNFAVAVHVPSCSYSCPAPANSLLSCLRTVSWCAWLQGMCAL